jgi:hypothetical protein
MSSELKMRTESVDVEVDNSEEMTPSRMKESKKRQIYSDPITAFCQYD